MYSVQVLDHFERPRNSGELADATVRVQVENPVCGDILELALTVEQETIIAVRFRARGCVASVACASKLTEYVAGKTLDHARKMKAEALAESMGGLPPASTHAAHLAIDALAQALRQLPTTGR